MNFRGDFLDITGGVISDPKNMVDRGVIADTTKIVVAFGKMQAIVSISPGVIAGPKKIVVAYGKMLIER